MKNCKMLIMLVAFIPLVACNQNEPVIDSESSFIEETSSKEENDWYTVSFECVKCKVLVYESGANYNVAPRLTNVAYATDENGVIKLDDQGYQLQVNFKVICDEGYYLDLNSFDIKGTYQEIINNPAKDDEPPTDDPTLYRISDIKSDLTVVITAIKEKW